MGFLFVRQGFEPADAWPLGILVVASCALYAAGCVLNDLLDYGIDLEERPERPLPSSRVSPRAVRWVGIELLVFGAASAWIAAYLLGRLLPGIVALLLVAAILAYNAPLKRTPAGPVAMGLCRMLNVLLGMSVAAGPGQAEHWVVAGAVGLYVVGVTWLARSETRRSSRLQLAGATVVMLAGIGMLGWLPQWSERLNPLLQIDPDRWYLIVGVLALLIGWRAVRAVFDPRPATVRTAVRLGISSLIMLDAAACLAACGPWGAAAIAALLIPAVAIGQWIEST